LNCATTGRPGPVWLDIPLDIQRAEFEPSGNTIFTHLELPYPKVNLIELVAKLREAKKPVIIAGNGIRLAGAVDLFWEVMKKFEVPIIPNFDARDLGNFEHYAFGLVGNNTSNKILKKADFILSLGCRMGIRQVGWEIGKFGENAFTCMVDIDEDELNKHVFVPTLKIQSNVMDFLTELDTIIGEPIKNKWVRSTSKALPRWATTSVDPYYFLDLFNARTKPRDVVTLANGSMPTVVLRYLEIKEGMRMILNNGCGSMGYGLPAAIGAAFATGKPVYCMEGDGSLQLNIQELQTLVHYKLPVRMFVFNNNGYNSIRNTQDTYFKGFHVGSDPSCGLSFPNLKKVAAAYGMHYYSASCDKELRETVDNACWGNVSSSICELMVDPNFKLEKGEI
jgi:acetolactate synthase-1/2/3 large subunit